MRRSSWLSSLERLRQSTLGASTSGRGTLRKLTCSPPVRCDGPWKPTLLHLRMRVGTSTLFRRCGRGAGCPRNSRRRPAGPTVYSGFELIRGIGVGNVRLALCVRFTMIRNRFLATILALKRMFQSGRSSSIRYAGPSPQLAPSTNGNIPSRRWLSFLMKVPSSLLGASKQRYSRCRADANSCVRPFRGVAAAFSNNAQDSRRFRIRITDMPFSWPYASRTIASHLCFAGLNACDIGR